MLSSTVQLPKQVQKEVKMTDLFLWWQSLDDTQVTAS